MSGTKNIRMTSLLGGSSHLVKWFVRGETKPFITRSTLLRGLTNHGYQPPTKWDAPPSSDTNCKALQISKLLQVSLSKMVGIYIDTYIYIMCTCFFKYSNHLNSLKFWRLKINVVWHSQDYIANSSFICRKLDLVQVQSWGNPDLVSHGSLGSRQTERRTSVAQYGFSLNQLKTYAVIMG